MRGRMRDSNSVCAAEIRAVEGAGLVGLANLLILSALCQIRSSFNEAEDLASSFRVGEEG